MEAEQNFEQSLKDLELERQKQIIEQAAVEIAYKKVQLKLLEKELAKKDSSR